VNFFYHYAKKKNNNNNNKIRYIISHEHANKIGILVYRESIQIDIFLIKFENFLLSCMHHIFDTVLFQYKTKQIRALYKKVFIYLGNFVVMTKGEKKIQKSYKEGILPIYFLVVPRKA
jgi:hypothetical protein